MNRPSSWHVPCTYVRTKYSRQNTLSTVTCQFWIYCFASKVDCYVIIQHQQLWWTPMGLNTKCHPQPVSNPQSAASNPMVFISHDQNQDQASCHKDGVLLLCHPHGPTQWSRYSVWCAYVYLRKVPLFVWVWPGLAFGHEPEIFTQNWWMVLHSHNQTPTELKMENWASVIPSRAQSTGNLL